MFEHYYVADFENTTNTDRTYVYGAGIMSTEDTDVSIFDNIDDFMTYMNTIPSRSCVYFHNFANYDGWIVLDWLLKHGFVYTTDRNTRKRFTGIITDDRQIYQLKVRFNGKHAVEFRDTCKLVQGKLDKIGKDFKCATSKLVGTIDYDKPRGQGYIMDDVEREYLKNDVLLLKEILEKILTMGNLSHYLTAGSFAFNEMKHCLYQDTHGKTDAEMDAKRMTKYYSQDIQECYRTIFPEIPHKVDKLLRKAYRGGYCYNHTDGSIFDGHGVVLDVNSLYPFSMTSCNGTRHPFPYGQPRYFSGNKIPQCDCFIVHVYTRFKLKPHCLPFIQMKGSAFFAENEYISESNTELEFWLTSVDLKLFFDCYDLLYFEVLEGYEFSSLDNFYDNFIMKHYAMKKNATDRTTRVTAKTIINSSYGKTGAKIVRYTGTPEILSNSVHLELERPKCKYRKNCPKAKNGVCDSCKDYEPEQPSSTYIPTACFVCAYGRDLIIRSAMKAMAVFGDDVLAYIDTDSLHLKNVTLSDVEPIFDIDDSEIGKFACEAEFEGGSRWLRQKTYLETLVIVDGKKLDEPIISIKACGLTDDGKNELKKHPDVLNEFDFGLSLEGCKLMKKTVDGGACLCRADFNIRK